jgi:hypothetical protein
MCAYLSEAGIWTCYATDRESCALLTYGFETSAIFRQRSSRAPRAVPVPFQLDGEDAGDVPVGFSVVPGALRVIIPTPAERKNYA